MPSDVGAAFNAIGRSRESIFRHLSHATSMSGGIAANEVPSEASCNISGDTSAVQLSI
jgi:hypothetical protein